MSGGCFLRGGLKIECTELRGGKIRAHIVEGGQHLNAQSQGGTKFECTKLREEAQFEHTKLTGGQHLSAKS